MAEQLCFKKLLSLLFCVSLSLSVSSCSTLTNQDEFTSKTDEAHIGICGNLASQNAIRFDDGAGPTVIIAEPIGRGTLIGPLFLPIITMDAALPTFRITLLINSDEYLTQEEFQSWVLTYDNITVRPDVVIQSVDGLSFHSFNYRQIVTLKFKYISSPKADLVLLEAGKTPITPQPFELKFTAESHWSYKFYPFSGRVDYACIQR